MRHSLLLSFLLFFSFAALAQAECSFSVKGQVLDLETGEPVPFVTVKLAEEAKGGITDEAGYFEITGLCSREFDLVISHVGYRTTTHHHDPHHGPPTILLAPDNMLLESIVVEGEYNPTSLHSIRIEQLSALELEQAKSESLGELAGRFAGVSTINTGQNIAKPIIHGLHSNRVLIINNGVRHEFQNWGVEHAPEIDPSLAGSVEVVKGAATVRYGPDALGGVLLVNPPKLELSSGLAGSVGTVAKSNGRSTEGNAELSYGWKNFAAGVQGAVLKQGDLHSPDYLLTNTGKRENSVSGQLRYHRGPFDLEGFYSRFQQNLAILRGSVNGNLLDLVDAMNSPVPPDTGPFSYKVNSPRQEVSHNLLKLRSSYVLEDQDFSLQYAYQFNHRREFDVRRGTNIDIPSINLELASHSVDFDWNHPAAGPLEGTVGVQWLYQDNNNIPGTNTVPFVPNYNNTRVGLFAIEHLMRDKTTYEAGLRYDYQYSSVRGREPDNDLYRNELTFGQLTGSLGIERDLGTGATLRSNAGMAWRPPNISELYSFGKHQASIEYGLWRYQVDEQGNVTVGDVLDASRKPVEPEVGFKWINSLEWRPKDSPLQAQYELTVYANLIRNYIYSKPAGITNTVRGAFPYFVYDQDDALFWGADLAMERPLAEPLLLEVQGSYVWARDVSNGQTFTEIPPARLGLKLGYEGKPAWLSSSVLRWEQSYVFRYFQQPRTIWPDEILEAQAAVVNLFAEDASNFDLMDAPRGYLLSNLAWHAQAGSWTWGVQLRNIFDVRYRLSTDRLRYFADQPGRNLIVSLGYRLR